LLQGKLNDLQFYREFKQSHLVPMAYNFGVTPLRPEVGGVVKLAVLSFTSIVLTSLAFEKSLESQPLDFYPRGMYLSFSKKNLNDFFFTRRNYPFRLFTLFSKSKNNI
jgi:hypothetical protein